MDRKKMDRFVIGLVAVVLISNVAWYYITQVRPYVGVSVYFAEPVVYVRNTGSIISSDGRSQRINRNILCASTLKESWTTAFSRSDITEIKKNMHFVVTGVIKVGSVRAFSPFGVDYNLAVLEDEDGLESTMLLNNAMSGKCD